MKVPNGCYRSVQTQGDEVFLDCARLTSEGPQPIPMHTTQIVSCLQVNCYTVYGAASVCVVQSPNSNLYVDVVFECVRGGAGGLRMDASQLDARRLVAGNAQVTLRIPTTMTSVRIRGGELSLCATAQGCKVDVNNGARVVDSHVAALRVRSGLTMTNSTVGCLDSKSGSQPVLLEGCNFLRNCTVATGTGAVTIRKCELGPAFTAWSVSGHVRVDP